MTCNLLLGLFSHGVVCRPAVLLYDLPMSAARCACLAGQGGDLESESVTAYPIEDITDAVSVFKATTEPHAESSMESAMPLGDLSKPGPSLSDPNYVIWGKLSALKIRLSRAVLKALKKGGVALEKYAVLLVLCVGNMLCLKPATVLRIEQHCPGWLMPAHNSPCQVTLWQLAIALTCGYSASAPSRLHVDNLHYNVDSNTCLSNCCGAGAVLLLRMLRPDNVWLLFLCLFCFHPQWQLCLDVCRA